MKSYICEIKLNPMYQDVKFIQGTLYYEEYDGQLYPLKLPMAVGGGGGGRGRKGDTGPAGPAWFIPSLTTAQRLALVPTTAFIVEDTDLDDYFKWSTITSSWIPF